MAERQEAKKRVGPIDEQISKAIVSGFHTVMRQQSAKDAETLRVLREISQSTRMMADVSHGRSLAAQIHTMPGVLGTPGHHANQARMAEAIRTTAEAAGGGPVGGATRLDPEVSAGQVAKPNMGHFGGGAEQAKAKMAMWSPENTRERIRDHVYDFVAHRAEPWADKPYGPLGAPERQVRRGYHQDQQGNWLSPAGKTVSEDEAHAMVHVKPGISFDAYGRPRVMHGKRSVFASPGESGMEEIGADTISQVERRRAMAGTAMGAVEAWKEGEPVGRAVASMFPAGVLKAAGIAGVAYETANKGREFVQSQYKQNLNYQRVYGGSQMDALKERGSRMWNSFVWDWTNPLGGEAYNELYGQAMNLGMRGGARTDYINQGAQMMRSGVSGEQVKEIFSIATEAGQGLSGLVSAIKEIGVAAKEASWNAETARTVFINNYKASSSLLLGNGGAAKQLAEAFTLNQVQLGHVYGNQVNYSGMLGQTPQLMAAFQLGLSPSQLQTVNALNPSLALGAQVNIVKSMANLMRPDTAQAKQQSPMDVVNAFMADYKRRGVEFNPHIDTKKLGDALTAAGFNNEQMRPLLEAQGIAITDEGAIPGLFGTLLAGFGPDKTAADLQAKKESELSAAPTFAKGARIDQTITQQAIRDSYLSKAAGVSGKSWEETLGKMVKTGVVPGTTLKRNTVTQDLSSVTKTLMNTAGIDPNTQVEVRAAEGDEVVSMSDAIIHFQDQIINGSAYIASGTFSGQAVRDVLGLPNTFAQLPASSPSIASMKIKYQKSTDYWAKQDAAATSGTKESAGKTTTQVKLELSAKAQEMFQTYVNGKPYSGGVLP